MTDQLFGTGFRPDRGPDLIGRARSAARRKEVLARLSALSDERIIGAPRKRNQGGSSACLPFAIVQAVHLWRAARGLPDPVLSEWFLYYYTRRRRSRRVVDEGSSPSYAVKAAEKHGICELEDWKKDVPGFGINELPNDVAHFEAQCCLVELVPIYARGREISDRIADSIERDQPCIVALPTDRGLQRLTQTEPIGPPTGDTSGLRHAMCAYGQRLRSDTRRDILFSNSWRADWAGDGSAWFSPDYLELANWVAFVRSVREVSLG